MSRSLTIASILFSFIIITTVIFLLVRKKVSIKYALIWIMLFLILLIAVIAPGFLIWITHILGFKTASNMVISAIISVLIVITIALTVIVSNQDRKIRLLIQEISIIKANNLNNIKKDKTDEK